MDADRNSRKHFMFLCFKYMLIELNCFSIVMKAQMTSENSHGPRQSPERCVIRTQNTTFFVTIFCILYQIQYNTLCLSAYEFLKILLPHYLVHLFIKFGVKTPIVGHLIGVVVQRKLMKKGGLWLWLCMTLQKKGGSKPPPPPGSDAYAMLLFQCSVSF